MKSITSSEYSLEIKKLQPIYHQFYLWLLKYLKEHKQLPSYEEFLTHMAYTNITNINSVNDTIYKEGIKKLINQKLDSLIELEPIASNEDHET
jgi:hypothetical protein